MGLLSRFAGAALVAIALVSAASAGVNTPQSGWYSGSPLLGPNTLTDLACAGSTCYASGRFGTLLKSKDAGATWAGIVTGLTLDLSRVRLAGGSGDRVLVGGGCALRRSDDGGDTFFRLPFTARDTGCRDQLASVSFPTAGTGYLLLSTGRVLSTADAGHTFTRRTPVPGGATDIHCTAERTCFATGPTGLIERTTDGAVSWTQVANFPGSSLVGLERADSATLYAVGYNLTVVKSVDGGATWMRKTVHDVPGANLRSIRCGDALACLITTEQGTLVRTADGGENYTSVVPSSDQTFAVSFAGPTRAVAAGAFGSAEVSNDQGDSWAPVGSRIGGVFRTLSAASDSVAYAGGDQGVLARTSDGGQTWSNVSPPTDATILSLAGVGPDRLYVLASDGSLQRSSNGGGSYSLLNPGTTAPVSLAAVEVNRLLLIGPRGLVYSADGGETFDQIQDRAVRNVRLSAVDFGAGSVVAYGPRAAAVSTNGARNWRKLALPRKRIVGDLDFANPRLGFVLDTRGMLWRTANGGRSWSQVSTLGTSAGYAVSFADRLNGYVAVPAFGSVHGGLVLRTADGGRTWHPQLVSPALVNALATFNLGSTDYALADGSFLYATMRRGDTGAPEKLTISAEPRSLPKAGRVRVSGRLNPADGGEEVVVARLAGGRWATQKVIAASNGTFVTRWRVSRGSVFVAQVLGDADHVGTGTPPLAVRVG
jgi:photosystem II stability/assembly factor-like uncharacterized protein